MNKYQKQLTKEIKQFMGIKNMPNEEFKKFRKWVRFNHKISWGSPCSDCDSECMNPNKRFVCAYNK